MKCKKLFSICLSALLILTTGCSTTNGKNVTNSGTGSAAESLSSESPSSGSPETSSTQSAVSQSVSSKSVSSKEDLSEKTSSAPEARSKEQTDSEWVAYRDDDYGLHIKKKDGTEDRALVDDMVIAPCVAGEWVYFLSDLSTIEKIRLDGSKRTKVCGTDVMQHLNGNMSITSEYKDGYILYRTQQCHEVGNNESYPAHFYKLDPDTNKITEVNYNEM